MLKLVAASFDLFLGTLLGAVGLPLALWVLVALYRAELARESALWALELSPLSHGTAVQLAGDLTQRNALIALGIAAAVLCAMAFAALRSARSELRPVGATTHGGKVRIELVTNPLRVGAPVAGSIWLSRRMEPDDAIRVGLSCKRIHGSGVDQTAEVAFSEVRDVAPVRTSHGWSAPFRFEVPAIAPPSGNGFDWRLAYTLSRRELPSLVALELGPAPEGAFRAIETQAALDARSSTLGTIGEPSVVSRQPSGSSEFRVPGSEERLGTPHSGLGTRHSGLRTQDSGLGTGREPSVVSHQPSVETPDVRRQTPAVQLQATSYKLQANEQATASRQPEQQLQASSYKLQGPVVAAGATLGSQDSALGTGREPSVFSHQSSAAMGSPAASRPAPLDPRHSTLDTGESRREPTLRAEPTLGGDPPLNAITAVRDLSEYHELPAAPSFWKWILIVVFGVPIGVGAVAFATVVVLSFVR